MVTFICETCHSTLKKQQIDKHCATACRNAWHFTCIECSKTFAGFDYKEHNECMTETQRYQGTFLEKQRLLKEQNKQNGQKPVFITQNGRKDSEKKISLRRFLKDNKDFQGSL